MVTRRNVLRMGAWAIALTSPALAVIRPSLAQDETLAFDPDNFTLLTETITTGAGDRSVTYRFYRAIPYVANPVDATCQSLNISVPIEIDDVAVDASNAPILFANSVGGYMPSSTANAEGVGGGGMTGLGGTPPAGATGTAPIEVQTGGNAMINQTGGRVSNAKYALAAGFVAVEPGARGRTLTDANGAYYGVAPAAIVDLKAAVRYLRFNKDTVPGNTD